ncbi:AI-2E family transporter [Streptacidiphilus sp. N1-5]|uniref:AI-2E family transporter n=1 Tax=Streptacidiphilus cavernicola TaxID=3342716 RepID=A0ABV6UWI9_9ACTN|nr:AI-2E family transporter [Streptacidiphilus jeojiense]
MAATDDISQDQRSASDPIAREHLLRGMPRWLPRAMVVGLLLVALFELASWAFLQLTGFLSTLLVSFVFSLAMEPAVDRMAARGMRRGLATFLVFLVTVVLALGFVAALVTLLVDQVGQVAAQLPHLLDSLIEWVNSTFHSDFSMDKLQQTLLNNAGSIEQYAQKAANNIWGVSSSLLGGLFQLFTIALFTFYFTADGPRMRRALCSMLPPARQAEVLRAWEIGIEKTGGYLYSRALLAVVSALSHYVMLKLLGIPYAGALAVWVGVISQFIPTIGTYLAGALPMLVGLTVDPMDAVWILIFVVVYQQVENYLLQPRITARTVEIHPAVAFGSVIAGAALLGAVGALIAIPVTATLQGFLGTYIRRYEVVVPTTGRARGGARRAGAVGESPAQEGGRGGQDGSDEGNAGESN